MTIQEHVRGSSFSSTFYVSDPAELTDDVSLIDSGIVDSTGMLEVILFIEGAVRDPGSRRRDDPGEPGDDLADRRVRELASRPRRRSEPAARLGMIIDHVGIAVRSIERSLEHWQAAFGYVQETEIVVNTRQSVRVVFLSATDPRR